MSSNDISIMMSKPLSHEFIESIGLSHTIKSDYSSRRLSKTNESFDKTIDYIEKTGEDMYNNIKETSTNTEEELMQIINLLVVSIGNTQDKQSGGDRSKYSKSNKEDIKTKKMYCYLFKKYIEGGRDRKEALRIIQELKNATRNKSWVNWSWIGSKFRSFINVKLLLLTALCLLMIGLMPDYLGKHWSNFVSNVELYTEKLRIDLIGIYGEDYTSYIEDQRSWLDQNYVVSYLNPAAWRKFMFENLVLIWKFVKKISINLLMQVLYFPVKLAFSASGYIAEGVSWLLLQASMYSFYLIIASMGLVAFSLLVVFLPDIISYFNSETVVDEDLCKDIDLFDDYESTSLRKKSRKVKKPYKSL